jgi:Ser/Thr protein kinase RdoA (MazF antagonist)
MTVPADVLARWSRFHGADVRVRAFGSGLINKTFLVERAGSVPPSAVPTGVVDDGSTRAIFQRLHPVFAGSVNEDIAAVTAHLAARGLLTTRVLPADDGALFVDDPETQRPWRALSFVSGISMDKVRDPAMAREGAALVARFHRAMDGFAYEYRHVRAGVHDTKKHVAHLERAVREHTAHALFAQVEPIAHAILSAAAALPDFSALPLRHCHGDLKISNVLFDADGHALTLVDLDTLGLMPWPHEMGDALRSWVNPAGEDVTEASVDVDVFTAAVEGYASNARGFITPAESALLVDGLITICTELAARFLADALFESYFGWDERRYASRGAHNLVRARGQWSLAQSARSRRAELDAIVRRAFA